MKWAMVDRTSSCYVNREESAKEFWCNTRCRSLEKTAYKYVMCFVKFCAVNILVVFYTAMIVVFKHVYY